MLTMVLHFMMGLVADPSYIKIKGLETRNVSIGVYANFNNFS